MADDFNILDEQPAVEPFQIAQSVDGQKTEDGENFVATDVVTGIADTATQEWLIVVGSEPIAVKSSASVEGKSTFDFYEGTLVSANGTAINLFDSNRITGNTPLAAVYDSPTITNDGTILAEALLQAGEKQRAVTSTEQGDRIILKATTNYLLRLTNKSGGAIDASIVVDFNEPA